MTEVEYTEKALSEHSAGNDVRSEYDSKTQNTGDPASRSETPSRIASPVLGTIYIVRRRSLATVRYKYSLQSSHTMAEENSRPTYARGMSELQEEVAEWSERNFPDQPAENPLLGVGEEYGELTHAVLKDKQGIRLDESGVGLDAEMDAVGDLIVFLADFCSRRGYDIGDCIEMAWDGNVSEREWDSEYQK